LVYGFASRLCLKPSATFDPYSWSVPPCRHWNLFPNSAVPTVLHGFNGLPPTRPFAFRITNWTSQLTNCIGQWLLQPLRTLMVLIQKLILLCFQSVPSCSFDLLWINTALTWTSRFCSQFSDRLDYTIKSLPSQPFGHIILLC
jgi:hypothetical protein